MKETRLVRFEKDEILFREGDSGREMYIIRSGKVRVLLSKNGRQFGLTDLGRGSFVGEMSFISGIPRSATVKVIEPVVANVITTDLLEEDDFGISSWIMSIARFLVQRIRKTTVLLGDYLVTEKMRFVQKEQPDRKAFSLTIRPDETAEPVRLYLSGVLTENDVDEVKGCIRDFKMKKKSPVVLDFSDVMDIDPAGINYLLKITRETPEENSDILIENVQLIRNKISAIQGIQKIVNTTNTPFRRVKAKEVLIKQGKVENTMFVVKTGQFSIYREVKGDTILLGTAQPGEVLGEMSLIKEGKRSASVRAEKASTVHAIEIREFYKNLYNVPNWFLEIIKGLVERLRQSNLMLELLVKNRKMKEEQKNWPSPLGIVMDSKNPGKFILQGHLTLENLEYLITLMRMMKERESVKLTLDLSRIQKIDRECIVYLLNLHMELKARGGGLILIGPQKEVLNLFKQYQVDEVNP